MKQFKFNLASLLDFRHKQEIRKRKDLSVAQIELAKQNENLQRLEQEVETVDDWIRNQKQISTHITDIASYYSYLEILRKKIAEQKKIAFEIQNKIEKCRKEVVQARQKKNIVENLKDKRYEVWAKECEAVEKAIFDELATVRFTRDKLKE
jgi:flagellar export protein FliJ